MNAKKYEIHAVESDSKFENMEITEVHISEIRPGDTILHTDGKIRTVCRNNISRDSSMGLSLFGDTYRLGTIPVRKVTFVRNR